MFIGCMMVFVCGLMCAQIRIRMKSTEIGWNAANYISLNENAEAKCQSKCIFALIVLQSEPFMIQCVSESEVCGTMITRCIYDLH